MLSSRWKVLDDERQGNELYLIRRDILVIPEYHPLQHRPVAYPQRAKVVGPEGETIYVDEWGRVKVRFYLHVVKIISMMVVLAPMIMTLIRPG